MDGGEGADYYFTLQSRLESFQKKPKGRGHKALNWPHRRLDPESFARAGFYFEPTPNEPDNVVCFLCRRRFGGWEDGDNVFDEHLRLSPNCGWAILAAIEAGVRDYHLDDPSHPAMVEARKATFAGRWPHEGKRGWKCKTKQMVDAGWKYTPVEGSDDMATCCYCSLALDGWEPSDKPMNEHYKRSPECAFFRLLDQFQHGPTKKAARGKRTSKASRLSSQSIATLASDTTSVLDQPAENEDSIMTTASTATAGGTKRGRAKKATTTRAKKSRIKKDEPVEVLEDPPEEEMPPPPPPKSTRNRKRGSDEMEESTLTNAEAPAAKKRGGRGRRSNAVEKSVIEPEQDETMVDSFPEPPAKTTRKKGRASTSKRTRKNSTASTVSISSFVQDDEDELPNDDELDRQLQADLDRPLSDDDMIAADSDSERRNAPKPKSKKVTKKAATASQHHAMFDPTPVEIDDADVSAELRNMRDEIEAEGTGSLAVPKKGRKAGTRKASKQTKVRKAQDKAVEPTPETRLLAFNNADEDVDELSFAGEDTVIRTTTAVPAPKKRGRPPKTSTQPQPVIEEVVDEAPAGTPERVAHVDFAENVQESTTPKEAVPSSQLMATRQFASIEDVLQQPATPTPVISPAPAAKQAAISPSQSPQSSDAENQPPSSRPSDASATGRVALAPVIATPMRASPMRASPSKRNANMMSGLHSDYPWKAMDLDLVFDDMDKENLLPSSTLDKGFTLTSPEKKMTVEEWIYHNAGLAEQRLRGECEAMVSKFESEGSRAMRVLEGLVVE